ncbi:GrpB family protein [Streptomyces kronopolitis]|uniref:GrpB family protein n=1 Tax=Streptomyces kronopolitis TaxID=1612435 RepID=UPI003D98C2EC
MTKDTSLAPLVVDHDPSWQARGFALAEELRSVLAPLALHVEHIGSTAIPGMAAKPVIDLQAGVDDLLEAEHAFEQPLTDRGFHRSVHRHDHVPAGCDDAPEGWAKRLWSRRGHSGEDVNLHVRILGAPNERLALLFRDWFRSHPEAVPAYACFKRTLADAVDEVGVYSDVKDPVVDLVSTVAETWAGETGWTPHAGSHTRV